MTDTDFARIKARFPALRWRRLPATFTTPRGKAVASRGRWLVEVYCLGDEWHGCMAICGWGTKRVRSATLGRCLRSLECAILREARALAGMVGMGVAL